MSDAPYGLMAEFETPDALLAAAEKAREAGYRQMDGYSPFPIHGLDEALGQKRTKLPIIVFCGGLTGAVTGYLMQALATGWHYRILVGGKAPHSWPAFIPVTFEMTILFSAITAVVSMILLNGLPQPYHPVFNAPGFDRATRDRFFLCIEAKDPKFSLADTKKFMQGLSPLSVSEVAP